MTKIDVSLEKNPYSIFIESGSINKIAELLKFVTNSKKCIIFSQKVIFDHYGDLIQSQLKDSGLNIEILMVPDGENTKSISSLENIYSQLIGFGCDRGSLFIALGGGVVGDLTGFVAATFMRGVKYIQIPTTLLAMVDSSIGGKTGVNITKGKNLVGVMWQPSLVIIDPQFLNTLPHREAASAMGEVIKYGAILDHKLLDQIDQNSNSILNLESMTLVEEVITKCARLKTEIVIEDELESDRRRILNFGHTIGHAFETYFGFNTLRHGEAVAYGMIAAAKLSVLYTGFKQSDFIIIERLIKKVSLPKLGNFDSKKILQIMKNDKKVKLGNIHFILLDKIGSAVIRNDINDKSIINVLEGI